MKLRNLWLLRLRRFFYSNMSLISKPLHKLLTPQQIKDIPTSKLKHVSFLQRIIPYLCAVKPENYDFNSIKDYLNSNASVYVEDLKDYCESEFIIELYKLLAMYSRSEYFSGKQIEETLYSSATPWVMYAYKSSRGIKYSDWKDPGVLLLGHSFKKLDEAKEKVAQFRVRRSFSCQTRSSSK